MNFEHRYSLTVSRSDFLFNFCSDILDLMRYSHTALRFRVVSSVCIALFFCLGESTGLVFAAGTSDISVGQAKTRRSVIAITDAKASDRVATSAGTSAIETVRTDLGFMDAFRILDSKAYIENAASAGITLGSFKMSDWTSIGSDYLVKTGVSLNGNAMTLEAHLFEAFSGRELLNKKYVGVSTDAKLVGHHLANDIVRELTGLTGIFLSKLVMVCDRTGKKEVYMMDFDGTNVKQLTRARSTALTPSFSPDGKKIVFSIISKDRSNVKNWNLYEFNLADQSLRLLSNRRGMNSGASYSPDGRQIALTMSFLGNPEIFIFEPHSSNVTRITKSVGVDVDPTWSPDGKHLAFVSSRTGASMVYKMNADGSNPQRLTYAGSYNATPSWSPRGDKIAFASWTEKHFDIFIMNPDGTKMERLTQSQGNNEDPSFSPDGNLIAFSSSRGGSQKNIYVMSLDGNSSKRLTYGLGNCTAPKWSNPPAR